MVQSLHFAVLAVCVLAVHGRRGEGGGGWRDPPTMEPTMEPEPEPEQHPACETMRPEGLTGSRPPAPLALTDSGVLDMDQGHGHYQNCRWLLTCTSGSPILVFSTFITEARFDFLNVYDGAEDSAVRIGRFHGTTVPAAVTGSGADLLLEFTSDASVSSDGFRASFSCGEPYSGPVRAPDVSLCCVRARASLWCVCARASLCCLCVLLCLCFPVRCMCFSVCASLCASMCVLHVTPPR